MANAKTLGLVLFTPYKLNPNARQRITNNQYRNIKKRNTYLPYISMWVKMNILNSFFKLQQILPGNRDLFTIILYRHPVVIVVPIEFFNITCIYNAYPVTANKIGIWFYLLFNVF